MYLLYSHNFEIFAVRQALHYSVFTTVWVKKSTDITVYVCTVVPAPTLTAPPSGIDEPISILEDPC